MTGFLDIEVKYKDGDFESKVSIREETDGYSITNLDFPRMSTSGDFHSCGLMMIALSKLVGKLNEEDIWIS